jgi:S-formylglutathione hydrolase FrmB
MTPGGHDWSQWDEQIPIVFARLNEQMKVKTK